MTAMPISTEKQIEAVTEAASTLKESYTNIEGEWDDPWVAYDHLCLEAAIKSLKANPESVDLCLNVIDLEPLVTQLRAENKKLREALDLSVTGIEWYHATYPASVSECDLQHLALCEKALHPNA